MIRKLISVGLCSAGVLTLLGAGVVQTEETSNQTENNTNEGAVFVTATLGTDMTHVVPMSSEEEAESEEDDKISLEESFLEEYVQTHWVETEEIEQFETGAVPELVGGDGKLFVNGFPVNSNTNRYIENGVTFVSMMAMARALDSTAVCSYDEKSGRVVIETANMTVEGTAGQFYIIANGRYLYVQETVQRGDGDLMVPLSAMVKAFGASMSWDFEQGYASVITGSGFLESGNSFYDADELFWLSRVIYAESGHEPLEGQMAVAIVVNNRVALPAYPDTILGVLAQKNQFSTYQNGALAYRTPNASSVIAAKLVMDGGVVTEVKDATHFDSLANSWADKYLRAIQVIGGHTFYM